MHTGSDQRGRRHRAHHAIVDGGHRASGAGHGQRHHVAIERGVDVGIARPHVGADGRAGPERAHALRGMPSHRAIAVAIGAQEQVAPGPPGPGALVESGGGAPGGHERRALGPRPRPTAVELAVAVAGLGQRAIDRQIVVVATPRGGGAIARDHLEASSGEAVDQRGRRRVVAARIDHHDDGGRER
jgi:hypothetical protein